MSGKYKTRAQVADLVLTRLADGSTMTIRQLSLAVKAHIETTRAAVHELEAAGEVVIDRPIPTLAHVHLPGVQLTERAPAPVAPLDPQERAALIEQQREREVRAEARERIAAARERGFEIGVQPQHNCFVVIDGRKVAGRVWR